mmetsp:Transcript_11082/g.17785  ORF Transcript_11082/g.17785 Transcript_11082/m.17785 type:complete len:277 (-) Transcript_11082:110-940(-)
MDQDAVFVGFVHSNFVDRAGRSLPLDFDSSVTKRFLYKLSDRMSFSRRQHVVIGFILLEHPPHSFDVISGVTPIAFCVEVSKIQGLVETGHNPGNTGGDLSCDKRTSPTRRFVVEQNSVRQVHTVRFAIVDQNPIGVLLGHSIRRTRIERSLFGLRDFLDLSVKFTGGSLVEPNLLFQSGSSNGIQHAQNTHTICIGRVFGHIKGHLDVTHGTQIVNFGGFDAGNDSNQIGSIAQITVMQVHFDACFMAISVNVVDTTRVETRRTTDDSMDRISFF